jgi:hypothetical protein
MVQVLSACILILIGLDLRISYSRWKAFGSRIELNPLVRYFVRTQGIQAGLAALLILNLAILGLLSRYPIPLAILLGAKLGLAVLQLKSLELK